MFRLTCVLFVTAAFALTARSIAQAPAEPEALPNAARTLCPMPVVGVGEHDSIRTIRPNPGTEYFIQAARVPCHNPLFTRPQEPALAAVPKAAPDEKLAASEEKVRRGVEPSAAAAGARAEERRAGRR